MSVSRVEAFADVEAQDIPALPDRLMAFCQAPQTFLLDMALTGPDARFRMNEETFLVLSDPTSIHAVLNGKLDEFEKGAVIEIPREFWRQGIITVEGAGWTEQHGMLAPLFTRRRIRQLEPVIAQIAARRIAGWAALPPGEPIDLLTDVNRFTFDVVAFGLLGIAEGEIADGLFATFSELDRIESVRLRYLAKRFSGAGQGGFRRSASELAIERLDRLTTAVADERLARTEQPDDLLGAVMATEAFQAYTPERQRIFLADQVATMLSAGYVTTGESIFWALYLLARHPAAQQRAREEILQTTSALIGEAPVDAPPFLAAAINEGHRLYPAVWFMGRVPLRDVRIGDIDIPAGTRVICSPYVLHRMPALWPEPEQYRPERFLPGASPPVTPRSLIPFGTGMRACLGRGLAQMEMAALACLLLARFEIELVSDAPITLAGAFTMHPRERVMFRLKALS